VSADYVCFGKHLETIFYWSIFRIEEVYCVGLGVIDGQTVNLGDSPVEVVCLKVEYEDGVVSPLLKFC